MWGSHAEAVTWLEDQLQEMGDWRKELVNRRTDESGVSLERLDDHRDWLERRLADLQSHQTQLT